MKNEDTGEVLNQTAFSQQVAYLSRGALDFELTQDLADLVKAVRDTGKPGTLTLKLKVARLNERDENAVKITPEISTKLPKIAPYEAVMFSTADGDLLRNDPKQRQLDLQEVPRKERGPIVDPNVKPGAPAAQQQPA